MTAVLPEAAEASPAMAAASPELAVVSMTRRAVAAVAAAMTALMLLLLFCAGLSSQSGQTQGTGLNTSAVPKAYVPWVLRAGSLCSAIPPAVIAAQDQTESGWNPRAVSGAGAEGIAQFLPSSWPAWGRNDDGTGNVSPDDPLDAIMAQGRYDCSLAATAQRLINDGQASGSATDLALAAYNAGPGAVEQAHGIPAAAASYVQKIDHLAATTYAAATTTTASQAGATAVAAAETALGTPYSYGGSCSDPHGGNPSGWCDCSSLVQMAWRAAGVSLPRQTYQQWHSGTPVASVSQLVPGDLVFIPGSDATPAGPGHVGMYVGNGMLINAPETGQVVRLEPVSSWKSQIVAMRHIRLGDPTMSEFDDGFPPGDDPFAIGDEEEAPTMPKPPPRMTLLEWVEQVFAPMVQRRVDLGRGRTWCACWWAHPEVAVRLDALRLAWYELTAPPEPGADPGAGYSAWWVNHVDPTLMTLLDGDTGPMSGCRPDRHSDSPVPPLKTESPDGRNDA